MDPHKLDYSNPPPTVLKFLESRAFIRGLRGPIGSGKSTACCYEIMARGFAQRPGADGIARTRFVVVRNTYPELKTTTIRTWHAMIPASMGDWYEQGPPRHVLKFAHTDGHSVEIEVIFLALDSAQSDVSKVLSLEVTGVWVNEAREVAKPIIDGLTGRVGRYPSATQGGCTWAGLILDTNSPDSDHWWHTLAERDVSTEGGRQMIESLDEAAADLRRLGILEPDQPLFEFYAQPSGLAEDAENIANLRPGYYQFAMAGKSEDWINVYVRGEYGYVQDGKPVHTDYRDSVHCKPCQYVPGLPLIVGMDFGLTPAAAYLQMARNGQWRCIGELCATRMGIAKFGPVMARDIQQRFPGAQVQVWGDPAGNAMDGNERTVFQVLAANGVVARPAPTQDVTLRRESLAGPLRRMIDGQPGFIIDPCAQMIRKGLAGKFRLKRLKVVGDERYEDKPDKNDWSHPCEALEYGLLGGGENPRVMKGNIPTQAIHVKNNWKVFDRGVRG